MNGQVNTDGKGQYGNTEDLHHHGDQRADDHQMPRKLRVHHAFHDHLHQRCLRSRQLFRAKAPRRVQQIQRTADGKRRRANTDDLTDLLLLGGCAKQISGFEVLRGVARNCRDDTNDRTDGNRRAHSLGANRAGKLQDQGRDQKRRDRHARNGIVAAADQANHTGGNGSKEETEDHDDDRADEVHGNGGNEPYRKGQNRNGDQDDLDIDIRRRTVQIRPRRALHVFQRATEGANDQRKGFDQADDTACRQRARANVTNVVAPNTAGSACGVDFSNRLGCRGIHHDILTEQHDQRNQHEPAQHAAREHIRGNARSANITDAHYRRIDLRADLSRKTLDLQGNLTGYCFDTVDDKLKRGGKAHARKYGGGIRSAFLTRKKHLGARRSLGIRKNTVLLDDQRVAQRNHKEYAEKTAEKSDQRNGNKTGLLHLSLCRPQKERRQGKDRACRERFSRRTDGLYQIALQNRIFLHDHADHPHGDHRRRNRRGNRHSHTKSKISVRRAENNGEQNAHYD